MKISAGWILSAPAGKIPLLLDCKVVASSLSSNSEDRLHQAKSERFCGSSEAMLHLEMPTGWAVVVVSPIRSFFRIEVSDMIERIFSSRKEISGKKKFFWLCCFA